MKTKTKTQKLCVDHQIIDLDLPGKTTDMHCIGQPVAKNETFSSHSGVHFDTLLRRSQESVRYILNGFETGRTVLRF